MSFDGTLMPVMIMGNCLIGLHPLCSVLKMRLLQFRISCYRKLLTARRLLIVNLRYLKTNQDVVKVMTLMILRQSFKKLKNLLRNIKLALMITYATQKAQLLSDVEDLFSRCLQLHDSTMSDALCNRFKDCPPETDLGLEENVSQIASCQGSMKQVYLNCCFRVRI